jgi:hypothetical protein
MLVMGVPMKARVVVFFLAIATSVFAQAGKRGFGGVVFPGGGTSTGSTNVTRNFGGVVFPGGSPSNLVIGRPAVPPNTNANRNFQRTPTSSRRRSTGQVYVSAYPVYVGGFDNGYASQEPAPAQRATPVMIQAGPDGDFTTVPQNFDRSGYERPHSQITAVEEEPAAPEAPRYLLAFKDHTIYSAVAYWADGETLHYFTNGNTHNQVSMSLVDRPLTERLNRELGIEFSLAPVAEKPAEK